MIAEITVRLPGSLLVFDVVPEAMLEMVRRASGREHDLAVELWTWLFNPRERAAISAIPGIETLRDLAPPLTPALQRWGSLPSADSRRAFRYSLPVIQVLRARFRAGPRTESAYETRSCDPPATDSSDAHDHLQQLALEPNPPDPDRTRRHRDRGEPGAGTYEQRGVLGSNLAAVRLAHHPGDAAVRRARRDS